MLLVCLNSTKLNEVSLFCFDPREECFKYVKKALLSFTATLTCNGFLSQNILLPKILQDFELIKINQMSHIR